MRGISFTYEPPAAEIDANRMDISCFVGFARQRKGARVPSRLVDWWERHGWMERAAGVRDPLQLRQVAKAGGPFSLCDIPVPLSSWEEFVLLFETGRPVCDSPLAGTKVPAADSYLAAAVRSFFAQGGRICYLICMGEPLPLISRGSERVAAIGRLLYGATPQWPGIESTDMLADAWFPSFTCQGNPHDRWHGIEHLQGVPEVSFLGFPDLPDLLASEAAAMVPLPEEAGEELFTECAPVVPLPPGSVARRWGVPRCGEAGYRVWGMIISRLVDFIRQAARDVQLLAGLPIPHPGLGLPLERVLTDILPPSPETTGVRERGSSFLQLAYPWLVTADSHRLPGGAEPPEGVVAGLMAVSALERGAYASVAGRFPRMVHALLPADFESRSGRPAGEESLVTDSGLEGVADRVSVFDRVPQGIQLVSDLTTSPRFPYRLAAVNRLVSSVVRAARNRGVSALFEPNSPLTWRTVERSIGSILASLYDGGALSGATAEEAFSVTCDTTTMTRNDLDNGRLVARVTIQPALPVERINVALFLDEGGRIAARWEGA